MSGYDGNFGIVTDGLVLYLDAANQKSYTTGTTLYDLSGNRNNGTLTNGATYDVNNAGGIKFDGINDYIQGETILEPKTGLTISFWFIATGTPSNNDRNGGVIISSCPQYNNGISICYSWLNKNIGFSTMIYQLLYTEKNSVLNNKIYYISCIWDRFKQYIYIDGNLSISRVYTSIPVYSTTGERRFRIGMWGYTSFVRYFNGKIFNLFMYDRGLSPQEILQNYNALKGRFGY